MKGLHYRKNRSRSVISPIAICKLLGWNSARQGIPPYGRGIQHRQRMLSSSFAIRNRHC